MSATELYPVDREQPEALSRALRRLPTGGTLKFVGSGIKIQRIGGGRTFALSIPPLFNAKIHVAPEDLKSITTLVPVVIRAHGDLMHLKDQMQELDKSGFTS